MDNVEPRGLIGGKSVRGEHRWSDVAVSLLIRVSLVMSSSLETHLHPLPPHSFLYAWNFVIQSWLHNHSFNHCQLIMQRSTSAAHAQWYKQKSLAAHCLTCWHTHHTVTLTGVWSHVQSAFQIQNMHPTRRSMPYLIHCGPS